MHETNGVVLPVKKSLDTLLAIDERIAALEEERRELSEQIKELRQKRADKSRDYRAGKLEGAQRDMFGGESVTISTRERSVTLTPQTAVNAENALRNLASERNAQYWYLEYVNPETGARGIMRGPFNTEVEANKAREEAIRLGGEARSPLEYQVRDEHAIAADTSTPVIAGDGGLTKAGRPKRGKSKAQGAGTGV